MVRCSTIAVATIAAWLEQSHAAMPTLQQRIAAGECSNEEPTSGRSFYTTENMAESDVQMAELFEIDYGVNFKIITGKMSKEQYVLTQCGQEQPTTAEMDAVKPLGADYSRKHFVIPVQVAVSTSTTHLAFLENLGVEDRVKYVDGAATGACWQKALDCGVKLESSWGGNQTRRAEQLAEPELVFMSCSGDCSNVRSAPNGVHVSASIDPHPMNTAEYVKLFAAFFNKEKEANAHFHSINQAYADSIVGAQAQKPVVAWISYSVYSGGFVVSTADYKLVMVEHAGGMNFDAGAAWRDVSNNYTISGYVMDGTNFIVKESEFASKQEAAGAFTALLKDVDVVIDETYNAQPSTATLAAFLVEFDLSSGDNFKFLQDKKVLRQDGKISEANGLDWFESRMARPDWAVSGLARYLRQSTDQSKERTYFRNIADGETPVIVTAAECTEELPVCSDSATPVPITIVLSDAPTPAPPTPSTKETSLAATKSVAACSTLLVALLVLARAAPM